MSNEKQKTYRIGCYSEDGASVYEVYDSEDKGDFCGRIFAVGKLYLGETDWQYNRENCEKKVEDFKNKWGIK